MPPVGPGDGSAPEGTSWWPQARGPRVRCPSARAAPPDLSLARAAARAGVGPPDVGAGHAGERSEG